MKKVALAVIALMFGLNAAQAQIVNNKIYVATEAQKECYKVDFTNAASDTVVTLMKEAEKFSNQTCEVSKPTFFDNLEIIEYKCEDYKIRIRGLCDSEGKFKGIKKIKIKPKKNCKN